MENLLTEIEKCIEHSLYQTAIGMTLAIPDMCGALESENGEASNKKYKTWFQINVDEGIGLSAEDCYKFRCSFLHQRSTVHQKSTYIRIVFTDPEFEGTVHNCEGNKVLNIDLRIFCFSIINAARKWLEKVKNDPNFIKNYKNGFRKNPEGVMRLIGNVNVYG